MGRIFLLWGAALLFPLPLVLVLNTQLTDSGTMRVSISLGLISYGWWLLAILLSVRPSWLDRRVGLPMIYALHGVLGVIALVPAYLHRQNTFAPNRPAQLLGDWAFYIALAVLCYSILFLSGWLTDRSRLVMWVKRRLEVVFRHQLSVWIHRLNLVVVAMIWLHVHLIDRVNQLFGFMVLFDSYTVVVLGIYAWRKWVARDAFLTGAVHENIGLNPSTRRLSVLLDHPATAALPGDYYFLRFEVPGMTREWHPFSATDDRQDVLSFTVREIGDFTGTAGGISAGTRVRLEGPFGRFNRIVTEHADAGPLILIGMGAGIAPLASLTAAHLDRRTRLLWSVHRPDDAYYRTQLDDYRRRSAGMLDVTTQVGRFREDQLSTLLTADEIAAGQFFIVGPNPAVLSTERTLRRLGVSRRRVHQERLTL